MTVSDLEVKRTLLRECSGSLATAYEYALRISAVNGPLAEQYKRVAEMIWMDSEEMVKQFVERQAEAE